MLTSALTPDGGLINGVGTLSPVNTVPIDKTPIRGQRASFSIERPTFFV